MRIVVLGAGFGGLELTTLLSEEFGDGLDLTLIDKGQEFSVFLKPPSPGGHPQRGPALGRTA